MFKKLYDVLMMVLTKFSETSYTRLLITAAIVIPLVITMYSYLDQAIFNTRNSLYEISSYSYDGFPWGSYLLTYLGVAKFDVCLTTIFGYIATAMVWSFTTELQPVLSGGKKK